MRPSAASTDAAATGAESRSPGKLYALATVGLAIFLLGIILAPPRPQAHFARAVVAYRAAADTEAASARLSGEKVEELAALLRSEGTLRAVLARLAADARMGFGKAAPTADELRTRLAIEPARSDRPDEAWIAVHYLGASHDQSLAVAEAICQEFVTSQTAHDGSAHRQVTAARAELSDAQERADAAYEKLETYLAAHFAKLENGPELIAAALRGVQPKPLTNAKPAGPPQPSNPPARPAGPATIVDAPVPPAIKPNPAPPVAPAAPAVKPEPPPLPVVVAPSVTPPLAPPAPPAAPRVVPTPPAPAIVAPTPPTPPAVPAVVPPAISPPVPSIPVIAPAPPQPAPPAAPAAPPTGPRLNPAYAAIQKRLAAVKLQQEALAATHTWAHPIVRGLVDEEQELKRQLRATPEILPAEQPAPSMTPDAAAPPAEAPVEPAVPPPPGAPLGPAPREPGGFRGWAIPRTSAPPVAPAAPVGDPIDELLAQLFSPTDHKVYLALQADYAGSQERVQVAASAERQAADALASRPASAASLREPPRVTARLGGGVCTSQLLLWGALAGVAGCLVAFWAGEIEPSPTLDRADDVANRLGLPVVATLPTSGAPQPPPAPPEPPAWVAVAVRIAEFTLAGIAILLVVGVVRSSELAGQLASDPLTTLIECCAWWRR